MSTPFRYLTVALACLGAPIHALGQVPTDTSTQKDSSHTPGTPPPSSGEMLNMDAVFNRPNLNLGKSPVALGGYLEANAIYGGEDGINEGLSFQARRLTIFMSSTVSRRIKFMTEIELEEGGREINIEFAAVDVAIHPAFNLRGGIVMNPIGAFNENHDGPKWEFVERPNVAVNLLPATWSNPGFGVHGKTRAGNWIFGYEAYVTNGFDDSIIDSEMHKTYLPAAKDNSSRFEESNNGRPLYTGKLALKHRNWGEIGISYMGGVYNTYETDDLVLDVERRLDVVAMDLRTTVALTGTRIVGEAVMARIETPQTYTQQYGNEQRGFFVDVVQPLWRGEVAGRKNATLNAAFRIDYVDWNVGRFRETGESIGDELWAVTPGLSFRPSGQTVFRLNYHYQWQTDILNNPPVPAADWLIGFSTYF